MIRKIFYSSYTVVALIALLLGLIIGFLITDFPLITFDRNLKLYEVLNLFLTLCIAISIPFLVKKWIDDKRGSKIYLIDELKELLKSTSKIKTQLKDCYYKKAIKNTDKDLLLNHFHDVEIQIGCLEEQLNTSFPESSKKLIADVKKVYFDYDNFVTGDELMKTSYTIIDNEFYRLYKTHHQKLDNILKNSIHIINCY